MITNNGKEIIAKYLMGTAPAYASYIALGCGSKPRPNINTISSVSSSGATVTVSSTAGVWIGAKITKISGTGTLALSEDTIVTGIGGTTTFTVSPIPTVNLSGATISLQPPSTKDVLDFEMFRVPIISRGYINDNGVNKIILTAELPTEERYEISEVGIFSAGSNSIAGAYDSKTISAFAVTENWQYINGSTITGPSLTPNSPFSTITTSLIDGSNNITSTSDAIQTNANNAAFLNTVREERYERCRYLNNVLMLRGNTSHISIDINNEPIIQTNPKFLQLAGQSVDFSRNSTSDLLKIAFSIVSVIGDVSTVPDNARVVVEFSNSDGSQYARLVADIEGSTYNFTSNRYISIEKRLDELIYFSSNPINPFSWNNVSVIKVYSSALRTLSISNKAASSTYVTLTTANAHNLSSGDIVVVDGIDARCNGTFTVYDTPTPTTFRYASAGTVVSSVPVNPQVEIEAALSTFFIALDAVRLDNIATVNPLYGLTGYSIIQNVNAETVIKSPNTNNYIEFRFILDVT
jgi:hypothetical protein